MWYNKDMKEYYDGCELLSQKDLNGKTPELFLTSGNRSSGKTTYFSRLLVNKFIKTGSKFGLLMRFDYETDDIANKFFKDIGSLFFPGYEMKSFSRSRGIYHELVLNDTVCGYALALNRADTIKKFSHFFSDIDRLFFDEFQSETNHYCAREVQKFLSIHKSIARGHGQQQRYVPVYMCSNAVSLLNPYFSALGISGRLRKDTRFLRGNGFVFENSFIESAAIASAESGIASAFASNDYIAYASQNVYLNDNMSFIDKPKTPGTYIATIRADSRDFAIREHAKEGFIFVNKNVDSSFPGKIAVTLDDHTINYVMLNKYSFFITRQRQLFEKGCYRFQDLECKNAILKMLSYI